MKSIFIRNVKAIFTLIAVTVIFFSCKKEEGVKFDDSNPRVSKVSPEGSAPAGEVVTLEGSGLSGIQTITFENGNVPVSFNPVFNNSQALIFRVPDTAWGGPQNIILKNSGGTEVKIPFNVIALPTVASAFPTDFAAGSLITINGNNLESVDLVSLVGGSGEAKVISKSKKELIIEMPATNANKVKLNIRNASGERTPAIDFVNLANTFPIVTDGNWAMDNWSWGGSYANSNEAVVTGETSLKADMRNNSWGALSLHANNAIPLADYNEIGFWIKGGAVETTYLLMLNWQESVDVVVPANNWIYFKYPLQRWKSKGVNSISDLIFQVKGDGALVYFDNIVLLK